MVIYPVSRGSLAIRELAGLHFADNDSASIYESLNWYCVSRSGWVEAVPGTVAVAGLHAGDVVDVLYTETDACEGLLRSLGVVETGGDTYRWRLDASYVGG